MADLDEVKSEARALMDAHGLTDWRFEFDQSKRIYGRCWYGRRTVSLSAPLCARNPLSQAIETILHEIAHAHAGHAAGHGPTWVAAARRIGCSGQRCYGAEVARRLFGSRGP